MIKKILIFFLSMSLIFVPMAYSIRTPTVTTIPPVPATSKGVSFGCQPFEALPGSVTPGGSGFIKVDCPVGSWAVTLNGTLTPSFTLGTGYTNAAIILYNAVGGSPCNFQFRTLLVGNVTVPTGAFLNQTLTFGNPPAQGQMLATGYTYCFSYQNAPLTGLAGFSVTWS